MIRATLEPTMNPADRRKHPRFAIAADVDVSSGDNFYAGRTRDISLGGLFIETDVGLPIGSHVAVRLKLEGESFSLQGEVMWALDGNGGVVGIGLRFLELASAARAAIEGFMAARAPLHFDMEPERDAGGGNPGPPPLPVPGR